jgi:hypothetical protein
MRQHVCFRLPVTLLFLVSLAWAPVHADEVTDWNSITVRSVKTAGTSAVATSRVMAIVHAAVYDAVNGIERRYEPLHVDFDAPRGASQRAAAVQAAYAALIKLYPSQAGALGADRDASLTSIAATPAVENGQSIARGIEWGQAVADDILAWRSTDHFTDVIPPFRGSGFPSPFTDPVPPWPAGRWQPTPLANAPGAAPQFAIMNPWVITSHSAFRPGPPPALGTPQWAEAYNEVKEMGSATSTTRTPEQTAVALFWVNNTPLYWNRIAQTLSAERHNTLSENARLFALLNVSMGDAAIACWDAKYTYVLWRPVTAIRLGDTDGNASTEPDTAWRPIIDFFPVPGTPAHPEYISGHSTISGAAAEALASYFGDASPFDLDSGVVPNVVQHFDSLSSASRQIADARVFAGIHYRFSCDVGRVVGESVATFVVGHAFNPQRGLRKGQTSHVHGTGQCEGNGESGDGDV